MVAYVFLRGNSLSVPTTKREDYCRGFRGGEGHLECSSTALRPGKLKGACMKDVQFLQIYADGSSGCESCLSVTIRIGWTLGPRMTLGLMFVAYSSQRRIGANLYGQYDDRLSFLRLGASSLPFREGILSNFWLVSRRKRFRVCSIA